MLSPYKSHAELTPGPGQEKTFRKWLNAKLQANGIQEMTNLQTDLSDGVMLIVLMELMSGCSLGCVALQASVLY